MPFVVGLAEYLWKKPADIFLFVIKFVIFMKKFIKQSTLSYLLWSDYFAKVYILRRLFTLCYWSSHCTKETDKKGVSLSFGEIPLQNQVQRWYSAYWSGNFLRHPVYPEDLILFWNSFWYQHIFWAGVWEAFILLLWMQSFLLHKSEVWAIIPRKNYFFIFIFVNIL